MIYVVSESYGEYDDYYEWPLMAYKTEAEAIARMKEELAKEKRKTYIEKKKDSLFYYIVPEPGDECEYKKYIYRTTEERESL